MSSADPTERRRRVAADPQAPSDDRIAAIGELARDVQPDIAARAALWRNLLWTILFDESEDERVRIAAAEAGAALGIVVVNNLCAATSPEKPAIRRAIVQTLHAIGGRALPAHLEDRLREVLADLEDGLTPLPFVNLTLTFGADRRIVPVLHRGLLDDEPAIRAAAVLQLARIGEMDPAAQALATDGDVTVRAAAAEAIGWYWTGEPEAVSALEDGAGGEDPKVAKAAKAALRRLRLRPMPTPRRTATPTSPRTEVDRRFGWSELLHSWSLELCRDEAFALAQDEAVVASGWTGTHPVHDDDLRDLEQRLGRRLPPSYRSFLLTTDGYVGGASVRRIRPAREVRPFVDEEAEWVDIWLESAGGAPPTSLAEHVASRGRDVVEARWELLRDAIQVSDVDDGAVYLLCPAVETGEGEWEAWLFATWLPGAARFASWWDLLGDERRSGTAG